MIRLLEWIRVRLISTRRSVISEQAVDDLNIWNKYYTSSCQIIFEYSFEWGEAIQTRTFFGRNELFE